MSAISCMRRLRVVNATANVVVRDPKSFEEPVDVEVRLASIGEPQLTARLRWRREWTEEQRDENKPWKDEIAPYTAAELILAVLGGPKPESVELLTPVPEGWDHERRALSAAVAIAAADAALTGRSPTLAEGVVYDVTAVKA